LRPSISTCTPRAWPGSGSQSANGKFEPTMRNVSQPAIRSDDAFVPSSPSEPVTNGRSSGSAARPLSALATPAPSASATATTSSAAPAAPWPISIATRDPAFSTSAARRSSGSSGTAATRAIPADENTEPWAWRGSSASACCTSTGTTRQATPRVEIAVRIARSTRCRACSGAMHVCTNSLTSPSSAGRSTSWSQSDPSDTRCCCPTIASTGVWSSFAS
jgi:hypothetical protein